MNRRPCITRGTCTTLAVTLLFLSSILSANSRPSSEPEKDLLPLLYETLGGDHWHNKNGWLDPDVYWCDWYGVECGFSSQGIRNIKRLELADNNLSGELTPELAELLFVETPPSSNLDLSGNAISGEMHFYPRLTPAVDLSDNAFSGPLAPFEGEWVLDGHRAPRLFLQRNGFSGEIPPSWSDLRMTVLDLSDNQLTGGHQHAIDAISPPGTGHVYLNGNPLEGGLTAEVLTAPISIRGKSNLGGGIDICFTRLTVEEPEVRKWLAERHVASGDFDQCLDRERSQVDATLSGSWYNPDRPGEGSTIMMLDNGAPLLYSFSFDTQGRQQWLFKVGTKGERFLDFERLQETRGKFGEGIRREDGYTFIRQTGDFRFDRLDRDSVSLHRHYYEQSACGSWQAPGGSPFPCPPPLHADRMEYQRLSELAGTACDNQSEFQEYSGAWYNPERSGEGFVLEVLSDDRALVYWFTYTPDGSGTQAWIVGDGGPEGGVTVLPPPDAPVAALEFDNMVQPIGTAYGPDFDSSEIEFVDWGSLRMEFYEDGSGHVEWDSLRLGYESGDYPIERLAQPMLAECPTGEGQ